MNTKKKVTVDDLQNATEIVLTNRRRVLPAHKLLRRRLRTQLGSGSSSRAAAGAIRIGNAVGAALLNRRVLGPSEARIMVSSGLLLLLSSVLAVIYPRLLAVPFTTMS